MHLLALGAFWLADGMVKKSQSLSSLNAPYGARCFLTRGGSGKHSALKMRRLS